ncbi:MAG: Holliday junction resolvase RuvX, partial [Candidatus Sedimenticola endophacoides]
ALVVGLPYNMDDSEAEIAPRARRFSRQLQGRFHLPVHLADERLTSREARHRLGRPPKRIEELDALAAKLILETWLSEHA